ncbi:MAG: hypothetical protein RMI34_04975 [Chloroherpetonaceae bacterium]|nr:hypothetical protein [Chloroherpetonaceae bacterium]MCS7212341.1 hypothetical protein [Chloroherpetonaceae bacterium]MDW8019412.1 hypothetical protein [Chloroherpetonaceae bacterium]MDW8466734.1 hypothetical protein [Chloroherpetonaceae bacterium]
MSYKFTKKDIRKIAKALKAKEPAVEHNHMRIEVEDLTSRRKVALEIYPELEIGNRIGNLVQVYTPLGLLQLHFCTGYVVSEELGEVILFAENGTKISGLIVSKDAGVTYYANVDKDLLSKDLLKLAGEVIGCAVQLALTEHML